MDQEKPEKTYLVKVPITHISAQTIAALIPSFENIQRSIYPEKDQQEINRSVFYALKQHGYTREDIRLALVIDEVRDQIQYTIEEKNAYDTGQYVNGIMVNMIMTRGKVGKQDNQALAIQRILEEELVTHKDGSAMHAEELKNTHEARRTQRMAEMMGV